MHLKIPNHLKVSLQKDQKNFRNIVNKKEVKHENKSTKTPSKIEKN